MNVWDGFRYGLTALRGAPLRSGLMVLAMSVSVASVVVLSALGEGARRYVVQEFASLGTNLIIVLPGKSDTVGGGVMNFSSETTRDLTLEDATALRRHPAVNLVAPLSVGAATLSFEGRSREVPVMGATAELLPVRHWRMASGVFLPPADVDTYAPVCVLGAEVARQLFGDISPLGKLLRVGEYRVRVIGVLATEGRSIGVDAQELAIIPVALAQRLFNSSSLFRILLEARSADSLESVKDFVVRTLRDRHQNEEDVTVVTQDAVLATFDKILSALTYAVSGIGAISLLVAGVLIMNVMLVSVSQRRSEIGLLKAIGAAPEQIQRLFILEALILSALGAVVGLGIGWFTNLGIGVTLPLLDLTAPGWAIAAAMAVAFGTGIVFGVWPAQRAARLDPVAALAKR